MALIWMKLAPMRKGTQARMRRVSCQLWMKATTMAMVRAHTVLVAKPSLEPAAYKMGRYQAEIIPLYCNSSEEAPTKKMVVSQDKEVSQC